RGDLGPGRGERVHHPAGARRADARPDRAGDRAPAGHRPKRRSHRCCARGAYRRGWTSRRAARARRPLPPALRVADGGGHHVSTTVGSGKYTYEVNDDWAKLPDGWQMPAAAVTVDSRDRVYCFNRTPDHPIVVFDRDGNYLSSWGAGFFAFPHTIRADEHDNLWIVDRDHGQIYYFTAKGELLRTIGTKDYRSDTGVDPKAPGSTAYRLIT